MIKKCICPKHENIHNLVGRIRAERVLLDMLYMRIVQVFTGKWYINVQYLYHVHAQKASLAPGMMHGIPYTLSMGTRSHKSEHGSDVCSALASPSKATDKTSC